MHKTARVPNVMLFAQKANCFTILGEGKYKNCAFLWKMNQFFKELCIDNFMKVNAAQVHRSVKYCMIIYHFIM